MEVRTEPYTRDILRLAAAIPGQVGFGEIVDGVERRSRACGSRVVVAISLDDEGRVSGLRQAVEACAYGQAAAALMGARATGLDRTQAAALADYVAQWLRGDLPARADWPELAVLAPALERTSRHDAILLPFRALAAAIEAAAQ